MTKTPENSMYNPGPRPHLATVAAHWDLLRRYFDEIAMLPSTPYPFKSDTLYSGISLMCRAKLGQNLPLVLETPRTRIKPWHAHENTTNNLKSYIAFISRSKQTAWMSLQRERVVVHYTKNHFFSFSTIQPICCHSTCTGKKEIQKEQ